MIVHVLVVLAQAVNLTLEVRQGSLVLRVAGGGRRGRSIARTGLARSGSRLARRRCFALDTVEGVLGVLTERRMSEAPGLTVRWVCSPTHVIAVVALALGEIATDLVEVYGRETAFCVD